MNELNSIDWREVVARLEQFSTSELARQELENSKPLKNEAECLKSFDIIEESMQILTARPRPFFESLDLFSTWYQRLKRSAILKNRELKDVRHFCVEMLALSEVLENFKTPWVQSVNKKLAEAEIILDEIDKILTPSGEIRSDASETLLRLFKERETVSHQIQKTLDKIVKDHQLESILQDRYVTNREGRWVLPVKSGMRHQFEGLIHAASQSKQTVFMEPHEIIPNNNRLRQIEVEIEDEIEHLFTRLSLFLHSQVDHLKQSQSQMLECDIRFAQARLAIQLEALPVKFSSEGYQLNDLRHPMLVLSGEETVPNTVTLSKEKRLLLISGPNAGGKTVLLKALGLAAQMARCGLPVCVKEHSYLPFVRRIFVGIGDLQSVDAQLSTFAAHLEVLKEASNASGPEELILIDEICGSTDPEEGSALARSFIECFAESGAYSVVTSHFGALKKHWKKEDPVINGSLEFSPVTGPTYHFILGVPGQSLAIQTAQRIGIRSDIIERALHNLSPEAKSYQESLQEVEQYKEEIVQIRQELIDSKRGYNKQKSKYEALIQKFEKEKKVLLESALKKAEKDVDQHIQYAKVGQAFQKHTELQKIKSELPNIVKSVPESQVKITTAEEFIKVHPPGSKVYVAAIGRDGVIQGDPNRKGEIPILSNSMRLTVMWDTLKPASHPKSATRQILRNHINVQHSPKDRDRVIDLRGLSVEEALEQLERSLDQAALNQEDRVKVIHGHGPQDALKRSIHSYLSRSIYINKWTAGKRENGGDGITWAELAN
ncbi:Smr/MutS family protein [Bdellovibrionales bacterium]|nr:Smr/MutS family protein [Bdellovibrionales bacterium]